MPFSVRRLCTWTMVAALGACAADEISGPPEGLEHAVALRQCNDLVVFLTPDPVAEAPAPPYLRIVMPNTSVEGLPKAWRLTADWAAPAEASYCRAADDCAEFTTGTVQVSAVAPDTTIDIRITLSYGGPASLEASFRAAWISTPGVCR